MYKKAQLILISFFLLISVSCNAVQYETNIPAAEGSTDTAISGDTTVDNDTTVVNNDNSAVDNTSSAAENNDSTGDNKSNDYILAESNLRKLTEMEIMQLAGMNLDYARNEIYARKGHIFKDDKYRNYFMSKSWYTPKAGVGEESLSDIEKYNVNLIKFFEDRENNFGSTTQDSQKQTYAAYRVNEKALVDLNGDGKNETLIYEKLNDDGYITGYRLSINGKHVEDNKYTDLADFIAIVDIDKSDKYKEIIISDYGPSNDDFSTLYSYDGNNILKLGEIAGVIEYNEIKLNGSGSLSAMTRAQILQTWYFDKYYTLTPDHRLAEITKGMYDTNYNVFVQRKIKLYADRNNTSSYFDLPEGQTVKIIGTDNKEWCLVETPIGQQGWFALENFNKIKYEGLDAGEVFAGLCNAD